MKRQGRLIEELFDVNNLYNAFYKAQKGKFFDPAVLAYRERLSENLRLLQQQIGSGSIETGHYHYFTVYDPKKRLICAAPFSQRVLHHALMNVCHDAFEKHQIKNSFASRIGKGTYAALDRARVYHRHYGWFLKLDVRKYFESIDHVVLKTQLYRVFREKHLLVMFEKIIDSYSTTAQKSVPIGNLTSQYFANHYLSKADHWIKEELRIPAYVRYMDDLVLWHNDRGSLLEAGCRLQEFVATELKLVFKPFCLNSHEKGLSFLGYLLFPDRVRLRQQSKKRFIQKSWLYAGYLQTGRWSQKEYANHVMPLVSFTEYADALEFRKNVYNKLMDEK